jgi:hypothetical protein
MTKNLTIGKPALDLQNATQQSAINCILRISLRRCCTKTRLYRHFTNGTSIEAVYVDQAGRVKRRQ